MSLGPNTRHSNEDVTNSCAIACSSPGRLNRIFVDKLLEWASSHLFTVRPERLQRFGERIKATSSIWWFLKRSTTAGRILLRERLRWCCSYHARLQCSYPVAGLQ